MPQFGHHLGKRIRDRHRIAAADPAFVELPQTAPKGTLKNLEDLDMYIGAVIVIVAVGCVVEFCEGVSARRSNDRDARLAEFPGLNG